MTTPATILLICFIWAIVAAAAGLTAVALAKDIQATLFLVLTAGLAVIAAAATWRLWSKRNQPSD
jgi:membrane protein implicated in regulation of membrane protease activity